MATVGLSFTALPEHVRTARLVASAVARRAGMDAEALENVRLAVGEACARAVGRTTAAQVLAPVEVEILDGPGELVVCVRDHAPDSASDPVEPLAMTLVQGLTHDVDVQPPDDGDGSRLQLTWRW